ncbi:hypothetical protein EVAR_85774_1 [Eumeta japonica]|uniref:Uncharacterized protein n=1 Tax=Eumeta variegata TaxID=151549 RepID=A0A4C2A4R3_EUMVA|nr:hypothetical protein EVAR_85774_1 [Eumeta japonica]
MSSSLVYSLWRRNGNEPINGRRLASDYHNASSGSICWLGSANLEKEERELIIHLQVQEPGLGLSKLGLSPGLISDLGTIPYSDSEHALGSNFNYTRFQPWFRSRFRPHPISTLDSALRLVCNIDSATARGEVICEIWYTGYHRWHVSMVVLGSFFSPPRVDVRHLDTQTAVWKCSVVALLRQPQPATFLLTYLPALPTAEVSSQMRDQEQI